MPKESISLKEAEVIEKRLSSPDEYYRLTGETGAWFESEKQYQSWLLGHIESLKETLGLEYAGDPVVNGCFAGTNLRPDIVLRDSDRNYIFEIKNTTERYKSQAMTQQVAAIGQLLLYGQLCQREHRLFLVDNCIHGATTSVVVAHNLPITLVEANPEHFVALWKSDASR